MKSVDNVFYNEKFNDQLKFVLLRKAAMKVSDLASSDIQICTTKYKSLKTAIIDFEDGRRAF